MQDGLAEPCRTTDLRIDMQGIEITRKTIDQRLFRPCSHVDDRIRGAIRWLAPESLGSVNASEAAVAAQQVSLVDGREQAALRITQASGGAHQRTLGRPFVPQRIDA